MHGGLGHWLLFNLSRVRIKRHFLSKMTIICLESESWAVFHLRASEGTKSRWSCARPLSDHIGNCPIGFSKGRTGSVPVSAHTLTGTL